MEVHKILNCQSNPNILKMQIISYCLISKLYYRTMEPYCDKEANQAINWTKKKKKTNNRDGLKTDIHIIVIDREPLSNQPI